MQSIPFVEYRCTCGKLLFKGLVLSVQVQVKCKRCDLINSFGLQYMCNDPTRYSLLVGEKGNIIEPSETASVVLGYSRTELLGMYLHDLPMDESSVNATHSSVMTDQVHKTKYGVDMQVRERIEKIDTADSRKVHIYQIVKSFPLVLRDAISEKKIIAHELVAEVDANGVCTYASKELADFVGKKVSELLGSNIFDLFPTGDRSDYREWFTEMIPTHRPYSFESVPLENTAGNYLISVLHTPLYRDDGALRGYSLVFT